MSLFQTRGGVIPPTSVVGCESSSVWPLWLLQDVRWRGGAVRLCRAGRAPLDGASVPSASAHGTPSVHALG